MSNISPIWPFPRQERELADVLPGAKVVKDVLTGGQRMGRDHAAMTGLDCLTRASSRKDKTEETWVATPAVIHWTPDGLLKVVGLFQARGGVLHVAKPPLAIGPKASTAELQALVAAFDDAKKKTQAVARGKSGGRISGDKRWDEAEAKILPIKERWQVGDQREHKTAALEAEAGVARNTIIEHIGYRMGPNGPTWVRPGKRKKEKARARRKAK